MIARQGTELPPRRWTDGAAITVAAWGVHGRYRARDHAVIALLTRLHYVRLTKGGAPAHPLYLPQSLQPIPWQEPTEG